MGALWRRLFTAARGPIPKSPARRRRHEKRISVAKLWAAVIFDFNKKKNAA
jgi:hypothetical protein